MHHPASVVLLSVLSALSFASAQTTTAAAPVASPDGLIVPFTSELPACATLCGPLFDVQGKCTPPNIGAVDDNCFCTDTRLTAFNNDGTSGVSAVCGSQSCTDTASLQKIKTWYNTFCKTNSAVTSASGSAASSTSTASSKPKPPPQTWLQGHYKWVIMLVVIFFLIVGGWIGACLLRRRYIRKREKEIEMLPPVTTGPHQLQAMTGGYSDGVFDARKSNQYHSNGGHNKEASSVMAMVTPANGAKGKRESKGWLRKSRS